MGILWQIGPFKTVAMGTLYSPGPPKGTNGGPAHSPTTMEPIGWKFSQNRGLEGKNGLEIKSYSQKKCCF